MSENDRQQRLIERVQEDERLRGDLTDDAATALVEWASQRVAAAAADPARPDTDVEAEVQAIRTAARAAARAGEADSQRVVALAEAALARQAETAGSAQAHADAAGEVAVATPPPPATERAQPAPAPTEASDPPQRRHLSLWRGWGTFANIWNRFRGER
jgi:hypothetical protein